MSTVAPELETNRFLSGNWAPVKKEVDQNCTEVIGTIPQDLVGCFMRNGPNDEFAPVDMNRYHFFDGDGMIHQVRIEDGKVSYKNRWVETKCLQLEREAKKSLWTGFSSPPDFNNKFGIPMKHPANTHVIYHNKKLLALWEAGLPYEMTMPEMEEAMTVCENSIYPSSVLNKKSDPIINDASPASEIIP